MTLKNKVKQIITLLSEKYPEPKCALDHMTPWELLVATILSAQCTDKRVNMITPALFKRYPTIKSFAEADITELEKYIHSAGFYHNKAKNIINCAKELLNQFNAELPQNIDDLTKLPGVGRKTANVLLGNAFGKNEGIVVDTHVSRLSQKIGLTKESDPEKIEKDLMKIVEKKHWTDFSHWLILHGRETCIARRPKCGECIISTLCERLCNN
ncbi:MAG: endonuclease III [Candidatus Riflebacteria bacterium]|nr:endonuclease III [Candidatus Riflebacteria bacterium]